MSWQSGARDVQRALEDTLPSVALAAVRLCLSRLTRHCCRITPPTMYGMNQAYNSPDPSAHVPGHIVRCITGCPRMQFSCQDEVLPANPDSFNTSI